MMKIDKNRLLTLTYSYDKFEQREAEYNKILSNHKRSLIVVNHHNDNRADRQRGNSLLDNGYCRLPSIQKEFCNIIINRYFEKVAKNTFEKHSIDCERITNDKEVFDLYCNKKIIRPIQQYLGIFPSIQFIACWMSKGQEHPQRTNEMYWHMDHHGHKFVKAFYYITDVKVGYGHHEYIAKTFHQATFDNELNSNSELSHLKQSVDKKRLLRGKYKISDDSVLPLKSKIINVTGSAGSGFAEDTRGLHRGTPLPPNSSRIILQCLYVPFWNGKDKPIPLVINRKRLEEIQLKNNYSNDEMNKLISCMAIKSGD